MKSQKLYKCETTGYVLEYIIYQNNNIAETGFVWSDYKNMKALLSLLRNSIDKLKKDGIKYIIQRVEQQEWDKYLRDKTSWTIIDTDDKYNTYIIKCSVDDYLENYGVAIGLNN